MKYTAFFIITALLLSGCYRMPTEDDCSVIPSVNNKDLTRQKDSGTPQVKY